MDAVNKSLLSSAALSYSLSLVSLYVGLLRTQFYEHDSLPVLFLPTPRFVSPASGHMSIFQAQYPWCTQVPCSDRSQKQQNAPLQALFPPNELDLTTQGYMIEHHSSSFRHCAAAEVYEAAVKVLRLRLQLEVELIFKV